MTLSYEANPLCLSISKSKRTFSNVPGNKKSEFYEIFQHIFPVFSYVVQTPVQQFPRHTQRIDFFFCCMYIIHAMRANGTSRRRLLCRGLGLVWAPNLTKLVAQNRAAYLPAELSTGRPRRCPNSLVRIGADNFLKTLRHECAGTISGGTSDTHARTPTQAKHADLETVVLTFKRIGPRPAFPRAGCYVHICGVFFANPRICIILPYIGTP